jgi:hypothetical protein
MSEGIEKDMARVLGVSYKIATSPVQPMAWDDYVATMESEWNALLSNSSVGERHFQEFFERHPCYLPQINNFFDGRGGHGPYPSAVITQPVLPGYSRKIPDFLWITRDSATVYAVLIEIEDPKKSWATSAGQSSAEFTQATNQIADWKAWFNDPLNVAQFRELYRIPTDWVRNRAFEQRYVLIFGRRGDPSLTEAFNKKRKHLERENECHMTYDRLRPQRDLSWCLCAKLDGEGYRAVSIPPTLELGPMLADNWKLIRDKEAAVHANKYLCEKRKDFLATRWSYWDKWANNGGGIRNTKDRE